MTKRRAEGLHRRALKTGKVTEFYRPAILPMPQPITVVEDFPVIQPIEVLRKLIENAANLDEVVILMRDKDGTAGLVSNLYGPAENLFFIEQVKLEMIAGSVKPKEPAPPPRRA
jgi:hypothetical protein